ncbi:MAG: phosphatidate cytidylyltransferase [Neisseriaceae bacterium]|nr:phosphatidate cytidylyltransferase [Neisseriaceae bacterium]
MTTLSPDAIYVFLGIAIILIIASILSKFSISISSSKQSSLFNEINNTLDSWWVLLIVLLLSFFLGHFGTILLFAFISFLTLREFMTLVYSRRGDHNAIAACFYVLLPVQYFLVLMNWYGVFSVLIPVYAFLLLPIISAISGDTHNFFNRNAKIQWGAMVTIFCISHVPALMFLKIKGFDDNILLLIFMIGVVQASELLQTIWEKVLGKRKILPALSHHKTVSGSIGGILSATLLAAACYRITPFNPFQAALIGFTICVIGFLGSLVLAAIKRSFGVKNWGRVINGHGGILDHIDSTCFAAPIFFHIVRYFWG